jgi:predicted neuraminidase
MLLPMLCLLPAMLLMDNSRPFLKSQLIFPPESLHNHSSCIVETPKGHLLVCWYRGSGERRADDVAVMGARRFKGQSVWSKPFVMADTPGFPDTNPCLIVDPTDRLWLFWCTILDNRWESALGKVKTSRAFEQRNGPPKWESETVLHIKPGPEFERAVQRDLDRQWERYLKDAPPAEREARRQYLADRLKMAQDTLLVRLGWMMRVHPVILDQKRLIVPLYSDGFDFSLMAITDDWGASWKVSEPLVGPGNVQPSLARRKDGTLVAYFRDNGPPPKRILTCESKDNGMTWTLARDMEIPDPGASVEALVLQSGRWLLVHNRTEQGRHQLAIAVSEDEGRSWPLVRYLEQDVPNADAGSYSYPSIIQARDGIIHVTYSYRANKTKAAKEGAGESIKHIEFNEAWLLSGQTTP